MSVRKVTFYSRFHIFWIFFEFLALTVRIPQYYMYKPSIRSWYWAYTFTFSDIGKSSRWFGYEVAGGSFKQKRFHINYEYPLYKERWSGELARWPRRWGNLQLWDYLHLSSGSLTWCKPIITKPQRRRGGTGIGSVCLCVCLCNLCLYRSVYWIDSPNVPLLR